MAHVERRGDRKYRARYRGPDGRERSRTFATKRDAEAWLTEQEGAKLAGRWADPALGRLTFGELAERSEAARVNRRASTRARDASLMRSRVLPAFGRWPVAAVKPADVRAWVARLEGEGLAPTTVRKCFQLVARVFDDAVEDGVLAITPCRNVRLPADQREESVLLTPAQVDQLVDALPDRYRALVLAAAYTGLRWGELAGLRVDRLDMLRRRIDVAEILVEVDGSLSFGPPKTKKSRSRVGFPPFLADVLAAHIAALPDPDQSRRLVFTSEEGTPLRRSNFRRRVWRPALDAAGLPSSTHFHALRHATASWLIDAGANPLEVAERLRHTRVTTTLAVYGHLFEGVDDRLDDLLEQTQRRAVGGRS